MASATFAAGEFSYRASDGDDVSLAGEAPLMEREDEDVEAKLRKMGVAPVGLGKAPLSSWVLARLAHLANGELGFESGDTQHNDGGGYVVELDAFDGKNERIGSMTIEGDSEGVSIVARARAEQPPAMVEKMIGVLAAEPDALSPFTVHARDPEWVEDPAAYSPRPNPSSKNSYGWDGIDWLGGGNVRDRSRSGPADGASASPRVAAILELVTAGATWEWTSLQNRPAVRLVHPSGGREIKTLTEAEKAELEARLKRS